MIPRWLIRSVVGIVVILLFVLTAREFPVLAVLVALLGGLAGLLYLVTRTRRMPPLLAEEERGKHERFLRDVYLRRAADPLRCRLGARPPSPPGSLPRGKSVATGLGPPAISPLTAASGAAATVAGWLA